MTYSTRPMMFEDYKQVRALWAATPGVGLDASDRPEGIALFLQRNPGLSLVAVEKGRVVGAVLCGHDGRRGYLSHLAVAGNACRRGIGSHLVRDCLGRLAAVGIEKCNLRIYNDNGAGRQFWEGLEWTHRDDVHVMTTYTPRAAERPDPRGSRRSPSGGASREDAPHVAGRPERRPISFPLLHVDAFTDSAFGGNPAAVCLLPTTSVPAAVDATWMQQVAAEMNLSETAFVRRLPSPRGEPAFDLRWFTPRVEVDLCGHATLAAAHALLEHGATRRGENIAFHTRSGVLRAVPRDDGWEMDFPATPQEAVTPPPELLEALGTTARYVGRSRFDYLVELATEAEVRRLTPDLARLALIPTRGVIVTSRAEGEPYDFVSRFFAPACGIDEDPVTGSAHCCLAVFWADRLGRQSLIGYQASARGGNVRVRLDADRVGLGGRAVTVMTGRIQLLSD